MSELELITKLENIEQMLQNQNMLQKQVLNFNETSIFLEVSHSHLYKLTSTNSIPFYKPTGKKLYFHREELESWLLQNRSITVGEIEAKASNYVIKSKNN